MTATRTYRPVIVEFVGRDGVVRRETHGIARDVRKLALHEVSRHVVYFARPGDEIRVVSANSGKVRYINYAPDAPARPTDAEWAAMAEARDAIADARDLALTSAIAAAGFGDDILAYLLANVGQSDA
jgi:hypothetical protein